MKKMWVNIISKIPNNIAEARCPICGKHTMNYMYVGEEKTRIGYLNIWCDGGLKGIYISRTVAPRNAKFVTFDAELSSIIPKYEFINN